MTELGTLGGYFACACDVNDRGQVVGVASASTKDHAFLWQDGMMTDLGTLPGGRYSSATAINDRSQVVGYAVKADGEYSAFLWQDGVMTDIGTLPGFRESGANDINNSGQIVGIVYETGSRGFLWDDGTMIDLGTMPGDQRSAAYHINDNCAITGMSAGPSSPTQGCLWSNGEVVSLGKAELALFANDYAINNTGAIVGPAWVGSSYGPSLYENGTWTLLTDLVEATPGWDVFHASDINDRGQIVGDAWHDGARQPFLLTPITHVQIDIVPGSDTNPINIHSNGKTPVAILGSATFDPVGVDLATVRLAGAPVALLGRRYHVKTCDVNGDGILDLLLHVNTRQMNLKPGDTTARLEGEMKDGTPIAGEDRVRVVSRRWRVNQSGSSADSASALHRGRTVGGGELSCGGNTCTYHWLFSSSRSC